MKLDNYKCLAIPFGAGLAGAVIIYATGAQKSFVVTASLVSGSAGALIIKNRKKDENATSPKLIIDTSTNLRRAEKSESGDAQDQPNKLAPVLNTDHTRNTPEYYFNSAHEKYESGHYEDALDDCISALKIDSKHVKAMRLKGYLYLSLRQQDAARESFLDLINNNKDLLARDFLDLGSVEVALTQYKSASEHLSKAIEGNIDKGLSSSPSELQALDSWEFSRAVYKLILSCYELGHYQSALEILSKWEKTNELNSSNKMHRSKHGAPHYVLVAEIYDAMLNPVMAIEAISKAIYLDPESQYYRFNRGFLKRKSKDYQSAINDFAKAFEIDPSFAEAVYEIGSIYFDLGDCEQAYKYWKIGSDLGDVNSQTLLDKHYKDISSERTSKLSEQNIEQATLHFNSGIKYKDSEEYLIACQEFDKAIAINPNEEKFYLHRAISKEVLGEYQEALIDYAKVIELNPDYANAFNGLGSVKSSLGDNEAAVKDYTKAISIDPNYAVAYYNRGYSKAELGNHSSAIDDFTKSLEIDPDDPDAYMNRGISKAELGDNEAAYEDFKKARELSDESTT